MFLKFHNRIVSALQAFITFLPTNPAHVLPSLKKCLVVCDINVEVFASFDCAPPCLRQPSKAQGDWRWLWVWFPFWVAKKMEENREEGIKLAKTLPYFSFQTAFSYHRILELERSSDPYLFQWRTQQQGHLPKARDKLMSEPETKLRPLPALSWSVLLTDRPSSREVG